MSMQSEEIQNIITEKGCSRVHAWRLHKQGYRAPNVTSDVTNVTKESDDVTNVTKNVTKETIDVTKSVTSSASDVTNVTNKSASKDTVVSHNMKPCPIDPDKLSNCLGCGRAMKSKAMCVCHDCFHHKGITHKSLGFICGAHEDVGAEPNWKRNHKSREDTVAHILSALKDKASEKGSIVKGQRIMYRDHAVFL